MSKPKTKAAFKDRDAFLAALDAHCKARLDFAAAREKLIGARRTRLAAKILDLNNQVAALENEGNALRSEFLDEVATEEALVGFAQQNPEIVFPGKDQFAKVPHGKISRRNSRALAIEEDEDEVVARLEAEGHEDLVRIKKELDKAAAKKVADEDPQFAREHGFGIEDRQTIKIEPAVEAQKLAA